MYYTLVRKKNGACSPLIKERERKKKKKTKEQRRSWIMQTANTRYISCTFNFDKRRGTTLLSVGNNDLIINTRQVRKNTDSEGSREDRRDDSRFQLNSNNVSLSLSQFPFRRNWQKQHERPRETEKDRERERERERSHKQKKERLSQTRDPGDVSKCVHRHNTKQQTTL